MPMTKVLHCAGFGHAAMMPDRPGDEMRKLAFLPLPEFSHFGLAAAIEPLFVANWLAQATLYSWKIISADGRPVRASNGVVTQVDGDLAAADGCETVFVLASFDIAAARPPAALSWLRRIARFGVEIGGIENGALTLAAAGLLDGKEAAVHWDNLAGFQELFPAVRAEPRLYTFSQGRITCAGAVAILDMMLAWIGRHGDPGLAHEVAEHLLAGRLRPPETMQKMAAEVGPRLPDPLVAQAQAIMRERIDEPLTCGEIAGRIGLSLRQTERRFARELGVSVTRHYMLLRMARAHQHLQQTGLSVTDVAVACGFQSAEYFARLYRRAFGCAPSNDRRQSTTAPVLRLQGLHQNGG
jgi:AraC family carnitine catabolism transcriptional activator